MLFLFHNILADEPVRQLLRLPAEVPDVFPGGVVRVDPHVYGNRFACGEADLPGNPPGQFFVFVARQRDVPGIAMGQVPAALRRLRCQRRASQMGPLSAGNENHQPVAAGSQRPEPDLIPAFALH